MATASSLWLALGWIGDDSDEAYALCAGSFSGWSGSRWQYDYLGTSLAETS